MRLAIVATGQERKEKAAEIERLGKLLDRIDHLQWNWGSCERGAAALEYLIDRCESLNGQLAILEEQGKL